MPRNCARIADIFQLSIFRGEHRVLRRFREASIPPHGMKHIETLGPAEAGDQIAKGIVPDMSHMDAPRRMGNISSTIFWLVGIVVSYETFASFPVLPVNSMAEGLY